MSAADLAFRVSSQHPRNLADTAGAFENSYVGGCNTTPRPFGYHDVMVCARGDLRQVGDREDLVLFRNSTQRVANLQSNPAPNAGIDLVKDKGRHPIHARQDRLESEHHA